MTTYSGPANRRRKGAKRVDATDVKTWLRDDRRWCAMAQVWKPPDAPDHFRIIERGGTISDVLVEVFTIPDQAEYTCVLAAGGPGGGDWEIPDVGTEVIVTFGDGETDHHPTIVAVRPSGNVSQRVAPGRRVIVSNHPIEIIAPKVILGPSPETIVEITDGLVHGLGVEPITGLTFAALGCCTSAVFAKKGS